MKLFIVSVELEALVLAEDEDEAQQIASEQRALEEDLSNRIGDYDVDESDGLIPAGYGDGDLVYHAGRGDITVERALEISAADAPEREDPNQLKMFEDSAAEVV